MLVISFDKVWRDWYIPVLLLCGLLLNACAEAGAGKPNRRGGVDWNNFDYRKSEQGVRDNDEDYVPPRGEESCLRDGINGQVFCE